MLATKIHHSPKTQTPQTMTKINTMMTRGHSFLLKPSSRLSYFQVHVLTVVPLRSAELTFGETLLGIFTVTELRCCLLYGLYLGLLGFPATLSLCLLLEICCNDNTNHLTVQFLRNKPCYYYKDYYNPWNMTVQWTLVGPDTTHPWGNSLGQDTGELRPC